MSDKKKLEEERKTIIARLLKIQKEFMELERKDGVTEKDIHHNPTGIVKEYKEEHEKLVRYITSSGFQWSYNNATYDASND